MSFKAKLFVGLALAVLAVAGCHGPGGGTPAVVVEEGTISIEALAARLGLSVDDRDPAFIVLRDAANTVLIFTHSEGRYFVNGKPIGSVGKIKEVDGTVYVSDVLAARIRPHLDKETPSIPPVVTRPTGVVIIDPGHGGRDPGTTSVTGVPEKRVNLHIARKIATALQRRGVKATLTRADDRFIELEDRAEVANRRNADLFVSIHGDSAPSPSAEGFTLYIATAASLESYNAAENIGRAMARTGLDDRGIRRADYRVLVRTRGPAVLIECGYLSNYQDARRLQSSTFQTRLAEAIADGIANYLR